MQLQNEILRVEFDDQCGDLSSLIDLRTGHDHLADKTERRLFRLIVPSAMWDGRYIQTRDQACRFSAIEHGTRLYYPRLRTVDGEVLAIELTVDAVLAPGSPEVKLTMTVNNRGDTPMIEVLFPLVSGWTGYAGQGKDKLTHAGYEGAGQIDPHRFPDDTVTSTYCGMHQRWACRGLMAPWMDLSSGDQGMWVISYAKTTTAQCIVAENAKQYRPGYALSLGWSLTPEVKPGGDWRSPTFGVGVHRGDWHETGRRYRQWLKSWWRSADAPDRLRESFALQNVVFRDFDGRPVRSFESLPAIARAGRRYGIEDLCVWDYLLLGTYCRSNPAHLTDYADEDWERLRKALAQVTGEGGFVSMLINARVAGTHSDFFKQHGEAAALRVRDGSLKQEAYPINGFGAEFFAYWHGPLSVIMCQRSEAFVRSMCEHLDRLLDVGFNAFFLDQPFELLPCYSEHHGHAEPGDAAAAPAEWIGRFRQKLRARHPQGYIIGEFPDVAVGQVIDLHWNWFWPRGMPETVAYSVPGLINTYVGFGDIHRAQQAFLHGFNLMIVIDGLNGTLDDVPDYADYVAKLCQLRKRTAHCTTRAQYEDQVDLTCHGALGRRFSMDDGGTGVTLVNPHDRPTRCRLRLDAVVAMGNAVLHRWDGTSESLGRIDGPDASLETDLAAHEVAVWEITAA